MAWWKTALVASTGLLSTVHGASRDKWISRSIYQIVTDRYARSDNSTTAPCDAAQGNYCGGTFQGIINKLDYVQELGFDAVGNHFHPDGRSWIQAELCFHRRSGSLRRRVRSRNERQISQVCYIEID